jgi:hypothetical protein
MNLMSAAGLASVVSFIIYLALAHRYAVPWLRRQSRATALMPLLWINAFRHIALQIFSAQRFGFAVSDGARDQIAFGDLTATTLALLAIVALPTRPRLGIAFAWLLAAESAFDLVNATIAGIRENLFDSASGLTWLILTFYVPLLWVSLGLIVWQLLARRSEATAPAIKLSLL